MGSYQASLPTLRPPQAPPNQLEQLGQMLALKNAVQNEPIQHQILQQQQQSGANVIQQQQQDLAARQALNNAYAGAITKDANGQPTIDSEKLMKGLESGPAAYQTPAVLKGITDFQKSRLDLQTSATDLQAKTAKMIGSAASAIKAANYDPTLAHSLLDTLPQSPQLNAIRAQINNPQALHQLVDQAIANSPDTVTQQADLALKQAQTQASQADTAAKNAQAKYYATNGGAPGVSAEIQQQNDWIKKHPGKGPSDYKLWTLEHTPSALIMGNMLSGPQNSAALDLAANNYRLTGQMPSGLYRSPGTTQAIIARAAELDKQAGGAGIAGNKSILDANRKSLDNLQKNYDQVQAFEETAGKNMDLLQQTAQSIPDLGARYANIPVRMINSKMIGTENMAKFNTALATAQTEAAKVLNSSNASGVLSDSARHELQQIIDPNVSYKALVGSLNTLKQDMANRTQSYQMQIEDIQNRIKGAGSSQATNQGNNDSQNPAAPPAGATMKVPGSDGRLHWSDGKRDLGVVQ